MKIRNKIIAFILSVAAITASAAAITAFSACGGSGGSGGTEIDQPGGDTELDITGVTFTSGEFTYDGTQKTISVTGELPQGVGVVYANNQATDAGVYNAVATLSGAGYKTLKLYADLTIYKADISGITFNGDTVEYDALPHSIQIVGNVPSGVTVEYTYNDISAESATEVGEYAVKAILSGRNYNPITLTATLKITAQEEMLYSTVFGDAVYFQNNLDGNKLYSYSDGGLTKVNNDVPNYFANDGTNLYYYSSSLIMPTIKQMTSATTAARLYSVKADYLTTDGTNLYYAVNNIVNVNDGNGIYKLPVGQDDPAPVRISTDKADFLTYYGGKIYYSNKSDGGRLYCVSASAQDGTGTPITENKITALIEDNGTLYYTDYTLTGAAIYKYVISGGETAKLTIDNGAYLTKVGNYLYYVNKDLLTSNVFGKGIYRVSIYGGLSEKVIEETDGNAYFSLVSDGNDLYYYKLNDRHFYRYDVGEEAETDLMQGFTPTADDTLAGYSRLAEYNGEIYFTSLTDGNCLYKYNPSTKAKFKVISDSVSNVFFDGNYMYYSTYVLTNYALWRYDLTTNQTEKISSHRYEQLIFTDDCIYAIRIQTTGSILVRMDKDGQNYTELYTGTGIHMTSLGLIGGKIYFCTNPAIGYKTLYAYDVAAGENSAQSTGIKSDNFVTSGDKIYYYAHTENKLCVLSASGQSTALLSSVSDLTEIYEIDGKIYFTATYNGAAGLYLYNPDTAVCEKITDGYISGLTESDGKLYYVKAKVSYVKDYPSTVESSDKGYLYCFDTATKTETPLTQS